MKKSFSDMLSRPEFLIGTMWAAVWMHDRSDRAKSMDPWLLLELVEVGTHVRAGGTGAALQTGDTCRCGAK